MTHVKGHTRKKPKGGRTSVKAHKRRPTIRKTIPLSETRASKGQLDRVRRLKNRLANANRGEKIEGRDIALFGLSDHDFYSYRYTHVLKSFARKHKKGALNKDLARLAMANQVPDLIKSYNRQNHMVGHRWSPETKAVIADELVDQDWDEVKAGDWD